MRTAVLALTLTAGGCIMFMSSAADAEDVAERGQPAVTATGSPGDAHDVVQRTPSASETATPVQPTSTRGERATSTQGTDEDGGGPPLRHGRQFDFQLEGAIGFAAHGTLPTALFARARAGMLLVQDPLVLALGPVFELGGMAGLGVGGQVDLIHLANGLSLEVSAVYAQRSRAVVSVSVGYAIINVEWQHLFDHENGDAIFFKLRLPVGVFLFLLNHR